jgi:demethylmenaquinone methyltransferase/2-methoxy-6-polyprenyl-1,4-benzoquinol methylase
MSKVALDEVGYSADIVMYDPIPQMLDTAKELFGRDRLGLAMSSGVFEYLPFRNEIFDAVLCGYSLRDAIILKKAISEFARVLRCGGLLIIVDLGKPDNPLLEGLVSFYLRYVIGVLAFAVAGKAGLKFKTLHGTYLRWPKNSVLKGILKEYFDEVDFQTKLLGGAVIIAAHKAS